MTRRRSNLVPPLGRFVGRAATLDAIDAQLGGHVQLLTLVGPPGMGKTRLAMRYAEVRGEPFLRAGGVWFCDLTEARDVTDVCAAVARALGLRLRAHVDVETMVDDLAESLARAGSLLIVLDNSEQLERAAARTVEQWCAMAPEARMLVTSRERLGVTGEAVIELVPLELPRAGESEPARLLACEAVALFEERARAAGGWDDARPRRAAEVAALVRELDGIPLAIELASISCSPARPPRAAMSRGPRASRPPRASGSTSSRSPRAPRTCGSRRGSSNVRSLRRSPVRACPPRPCAPAW